MASIWSALQGWDWEEPFCSGSSPIWRVSFRRLCCGIAVQPVACKVPARSHVVRMLFKAYMKLLSEIIQILEWIIINMQMTLSSILCFWLIQEGCRNFMWGYLGNFNYCKMLQSRCWVECVIETIWIQSWPIYPGSQSCFKVLVLGFKTLHGLGTACLKEYPIPLQNYSTELAIFWCPASGANPGKIFFSHSTRALELSQKIC